MRKTFLMLPLLWLFAGAVHAGCGQVNLIDAMAPEARAALLAEADRHAHPRGNLWRAERGATVLHIAGSMHLADPRHARLLDRLAPLWPDTELLVMEMAPDAQAEMQRRIAAEPGLAFLVEGPTLVDLLAPEVWAMMKQEMQARGVPGFLAAKFQPWYATLLLMIPACAMEDLTSGAKGLDVLAQEAAADANVPAISLDDADVLFELFAAEPMDEQLRQLSAALAGGAANEQYFSTMFEAYFDEEHRLLWEFGRRHMPAMPGYSEAEMAAFFAELEQVLLIERNRSWIDRLLPATDGRRAVVIVGAAHLSGEEGILRLLENEGFRVERLPL